uniref:Uncharacterized protein n=1 Tax=Sciurus vulgaris TaxID=55149 RepID=A0A8D2AGU0_SCIVU
SFFSSPYHRPPWPPLYIAACYFMLTCSGPMEDSPDVGTEVTEVMLICPVIWFMLLMPPELVAMDTLMFILLLYMLVFACCPKCGGDCCENMLGQSGNRKMLEPRGRQADSVENLFLGHLL